jgi:hypothetical protein
LHPNWGTSRDKPTGNTKGVKKMKMRKTRKFGENKKGIDTILAALLMVVIVVVAAVMVYAWATGLLGTLLVNPNKVGNEALNMETYGWNPSGSNTFNMTLNLRNTGSASITLASYYVKDSSGNQWSRLNWQTDAGANHPAAIGPNAVGIVTITIGSGASGPGGQCGSSCSLSGSGFTTFQSGYSYTVVVVTSRNNQFTFTVTR